MTLLPAHIRAAALAARAGEKLRRADPLKYRRMSSLAQRRVCEWIAAGVETYWTNGNGGGKTDGLSHVFLAMAQGRKRIDGRLMPRAGAPHLVGKCPDPECDDPKCPGAKHYPAPDPADDEPYWIELPGLHPGEAWRHWVIVNSYDQARHSSVRAYRKLLGDWPHEIGWLDGSKSGRVKTIRVKPENWPSDDPTTWSEIYFLSQEGMTDEDVKRAQGARIDSAQGDEAPLQTLWQEIRARQDAGRRIYLGIGYTPQVRAEWEWLMTEAGFLHCYDQPRNGRVRLQSSVEDNRAMSPLDLHERWNKVRGDPLFEARWNGEHVDASAMCPFPHRPMDRLLTAAQGGRIDRYVLREADEDNPHVEYAEATLERWLEFNPRHRYLITVDTSRGIDDGHHDPCEMQVWDWTEPMLVARYGQRGGQGGFLDEDALAILADMVGREYGDALVDWEVTGGYGVQFGATLRRLNYPNMAHDDVTLKPGVLGTSYGWVASATTNGEIVAALIRGLSEGSFQCWSADCVRQWKDVRMAKDGTTPGVKPKSRHHREAMICAGRALHWIQTKAAVFVPESSTDNSMAAVLRREFGRKVELPSKAGRSGRGLTEIFRTEIP